MILESPANPTLELVDIRRVVEDAAGVPVLVDNTFATPVLQRPLELGATLSLHSATKYLGGHGDAMGGIVATNQDWTARLRRVRALTGGLLHPLAAYLSCELITHAVSLGGVDSLVQHPASLTRRPVAAHARPGAGIVRPSIGLEHVDDLFADLTAALDAALLIEIAG